MKDALGDRIKSFYENATRYFLPRRAYTIIRIDGKAFHSYTKGLKRPFDDDFMDDMDSTACYLCKHIQGAQFAFVQSDEISILVTDFTELTTSAWFDNNIQKMCSVSASMATNKFNALRMRRNLELQLKFEVNINGLNINGEKGLLKHYEQSVLNAVGYLKHYKGAEFDSRIFQIPSKTEVENVFIWRQQDTTRNSIQSVAYSLYSQKQLNGKKTDEMQEMIFQKGINWNDYAPKYKRGRMIVKETYLKEVGVDNISEDFAPVINATRTRWVSIEVPIFTQNREFLSAKIPIN